MWGGPGEGVFRGGGEWWPGGPHGAEVGKTGTRWRARTYSRVVPGVPGRVLVVDDNKVIRQLIRVNLELEGFEVVTAADGVECLDVVQQVQPDVVTLDVVMPRLDGLRTAARLRSDARTRDLPIVVISACTQYEVESGLEVGVDAFLAKPFEPNELVGIVRQLISTEGNRRGKRDGVGEGEPEPEGEGEPDPSGERVREGVTIGRDLGRGGAGCESSEQ
nr:MULTISPECIES: response regulator [unclassified Streptomyces]